MYRFKSKESKTPSRLNLFSSKTSISLHKWLVWLDLILKRMPFSTAIHKFIILNLHKSKSILFDSNLLRFVSYLPFLCLYTLQAGFERFMFIPQVLFSLWHTPNCPERPVYNVNKTKTKKKLNLVL